MRAEALGGTPTQPGTWLPPAGGGTVRRRIVLAVLVLLAGLLGGLSAAALTRAGSTHPSAALTRPGSTHPSESPPETAAASTRGEDVAPTDAPSPGETAERLKRRPGQDAEVAPRWRPGEAEAYPNAKRRAARVVERLTTYERGSEPGRVAAATARQFGAERSRLMDATRQLVRRDVESLGTVVYPQLGGVRPDAASVMVVFDQSLDGPRGRWIERRTVDVRLRLVAGQWSLDRLGSGGGSPVARLDELSEEAVNVLEHPSIELTDSARWDIYDGTVDDRLLVLMASIADRHEIAVTTLSTGHPNNVFGTTRTSNHTRGRAVDIFSVDGQLVVDQRDKGSAAHSLTRWVFEQGVSELGSPWALDGYNGRSFTDIVHADHIHVAV